MQQLSGIRVLALEQYIAGPYCTSVLADAGAEVIKVERPGVGDPRRSYAPRLDGAPAEINAGYVPYNRGKKSIELDIFTQDGGAEFAQLLRTADVLVSNLRPGSLQRAGFAPERLRLDYPALIICEISGFGANGPKSDWPAFDSVIQATSGLSGLLGSDPSDPPMLAPMSTMDMLAGAYAAIGVLIAIAGRARGGDGTHIDVAMQEVGAAFLMRPLALHEFTGLVPTRGRDDFSPVGAFEAGDGRWASIVIPTDEMWQRTCRAMGRPDLLVQDGLSTTEERAAAMRPVILPALTEWAADLTADDAVQRLRDHGQPAGVVASIAEVRADEQLAARGLFVAVDGYADGPRVPRLPIRFDGAATVPTAIASLGEHAAELRKGLRGAG